MNSATTPSKTNQLKKSLSLSTTNILAVKMPLSYVLKIKRGVSWSLRRIEIDRERFKYFKTDDNELRFNEKIDDCVLREKHPDNMKKYYLILESKSGTFKEVKICCDDPIQLQQFKKDFDAIQNYKNTISDIQNQTFYIEKEKRTSLKSDIENENEQTVNRTNFDENITLDRSVMRESEIGVRRSTEIDLNVTTNLGKRDTITNINNNPTPISNPIPSSNPLYETLKGINGENWTTVKFTKHSLIEFNGEKKNILPTLFSLSDEHVFKESLLKEYFAYIKEAFNSVKENQMNSMILVLTSFLLTLALVLVVNLTLFLIISTLLVFAFKVYLNILNKKELANASEFRVSQELNTSENMGKMIKVSSIFNLTSKEMLSNLTNIKSYKEWNLHLKSVTDFKKEDNSAKYCYMKNFREEDGDCEIRIRRKVIPNTEPITIVDTAELDSQNTSNNTSTNARIKFAVIESSLNGSKCKVTIYIPLRTILEKKMPITYLKSQIKSLDLLHLFINNKNFNNNFMLEEEKEVAYKLFHNVAKKIEAGASLVNVVNTEANKNSTLENEVAKSNPERKENLLIIEPEPESNKEEELEQPKKIRKSTIAEFNSVDNKFSEESKADNGNDNIINENNPDKNTEIENKINISTNNALTINTTPVTDKYPENEDLQKLTLDPILQKENETVGNIINSKMGELNDFLNREWKSMEAKNDYKLYYFDEKSGIRSVKSEIIIDKNIKTVLDYINDINNKSKFDKNFDTGHVIREVDETLAIQYMKYKGKMFISSRDFTIVSLKKYSENEFMLLATSYNNESKYPKVKGCERADLIIGGFILKKLEDFKTHLTFFTSSDLKLSQTLVNTSLKEVAMQVKYIKDLLK